MFKKSLNFAKKLALPWPVMIQAPMAGGITTPNLVAAISNANGLGSFATGYLTTEQVASGIRDIKNLTSKPFSVNVFIPNQVQQNLDEIKAYLQALNRFKRELGMPEEDHVNIPLLPEDNFREIVDILLDEKIEIVSFTFGNLPADIIHAFKKNDTYLMGTATSVEEAKILTESGVDAIVAQGYEAGGHRGGFVTPFKRGSIGTMALVPRIVDSIDRPVIAAGGIMDGRGIVAAMALGASAVQMGTAFLATKESGAHPTYKAELVKMRDCNFDNTTLTAAYSGKMVRGINTEFIKYMEAKVSSIPPYPITNILSSPVRKEASKQKATHIMSMWSGQGVPLITDGLMAGELLEKLRAEIKASLEDLGGTQVGDRY